MNEQETDQQAVVGAGEQEALDLRNRCGHPGKYRPGPKKVTAFVEDITSVLFAQ